MESITVTRPFEVELSSMVQRCRHLEARALWPGASVDAELPQTLYYTLGIRLKAAELTDVAVEEKLGPVELEGGDTVFRCTHRCTWPDLVVNATSEYRFPAGPTQQLRFTYAYERPGPKIVKPKNLAAFHQALERVIGRYLDRLTASSVPVST